MTKLKGYTRNGGAVINTDVEAYEALKRDRARIRGETQLRKEVSQLRTLVLELMKTVEGLKLG